MRAIITPRSSNRKTGDVPTVWVGSTLDEAKRSCDLVACPLRPWTAADGVRCYAWSGPTWLGMVSAAKSNRRRSLLQALADRNPEANMVRVGAIGDPAAMSKAWWRRLWSAAKKVGLTVIAYTHGWRTSPHLAGKVMASCDSIEDAVQARAAGWQPAIALRGIPWDSPPLTLPDGSRAIVCPAMKATVAGKGSVTCNDCLKCTGDKPYAIVFPEHGRGIKKITGKSSE